MDQLSKEAADQGVKARKRASARPVPKTRVIIDRWDICVLIGAALVSVGWWFIWPPAIAFWLGAVLMLVGVLGARK